MTFDDQSGKCDTIVHDLSVPFSKIENKIDMLIEQPTVMHAAHCVPKDERHCVGIVCFVIFID